MSDYQGNIVTKDPATPTGPSTFGRAPGMWKLNEVAYWIKQGVWPNPAIVPDIYFPYVSLLLSTTALGNANNNLFVDSSGAFNPVSRFGNTAQGSFTPYATNWSNYFDASGDYERISSSQTALQFGTGDFTVEGWVYSTGATGTFQQILTGGTSWTSGSGGVYWYYNGGSPYIGAAWNQIATNPAVNSGTLAINTWHHFAVVRSGNTLILYVNGTSVDTLDVTGVSIAVNNQSQTNIGGGGWDQDFGGYLSNLRVVKGTAVYTANFTVPTSPLTAISGTSLLTCQSNRFRDASTNNFTITVAGNTSVQDFGPFSSSTYTGISYNQSDITNWSTYFNGSSTYLQAPNNAAFAFGTGDFTVEMWVYFTDTGGTNKPMFDTGVSTNTGRLLIRQGDNGSSANVVNAYLSGTTAGSPTFKFNEWTHVAVVRSSGTLKIYINGVGGTGVSATANLTENAGIIGKFYDVGIYFSGSMSNVRAVKGTAVYTANFTPPTTNLTAISGTSLLTCQNAAFTDNSTNNFVITQNGNPTVTGNSPFNTTGYWSNYFNGGTDRLQVPVTSNMYLGTTYTIEAWAYYNSSSYGARPIFSECEPFQGGFAGLTLTLNTSGKLVAEYRPATSGAVTTITGPTVVPNTWFHIALVSDSSSAKLYVDGTQVGATTTFGDYPSAKTSFVAVGSWGHGWNDPGIPAAAWIGYISNLRVVKGVAVYTSNFTPPTAPLTAISGTVLLTCQNGRFIDNSSVNNTLTPVSTVSVQSFDPFYTATTPSNGGSMYFDGNADYVSIPNGPSMVLSGGTYTLEAWVYPTGDRSAYRTIFVKRAGDPTPCAWQVSLATSTGNLIFYNGTLYNSGVAVQLNAWSHVAAVYDGTNINLYLNGSRVLQSATSNVDCNANAQIGYFFSSVQEPFIGYIANARILKGVQAYTGTSYTVPTAPANPTAATVLMVNGMNAGIYDATTINDMETVGNAQVSTVQSKFGGSSVYFDGSGDCLSIPATPNLTFGTGDFTMELWVYSGANGTSTRTMGNGAGASWSANKWVFATGDATYVNKFIFGCNNANSGAALLYSTTTFNDNTWKYVAITRSGNTWRLFVNGVLESTATSSASLDGGVAATITVGRSGISSDADWAGYIDDLRLTKGVARYTSNFTPPTQPFPIY